MVAGAAKIDIEATAAAGCVVSWLSRLRTTLALVSLNIDCRSGKFRCMLIDGAIFWSLTLCENFWKSNSFEFEQVFLIVEKQFVVVGLQCEKLL